MPGPDLADPAAAPAQLAGQAQQLDQQRRVTRPDFAQDAKATLQAPPAEPPREKVLDTGPADAAVSAGRRRRPDGSATKRFPPAQPMPVYPGGRAGGGATPAIPAAARGPAPGPGGPAGGGATALDPKADEVRTKVAAVTPTAVGGGTPQPIVLQDKGAASLTPRSPAQGQQIGDVLAKVKLKVDTYAQEFVTAAAAKLDPRHNVGKLTDMANDMKADQLSSISSEIDGVAAAAGVTAEALNAKVQAEKDKAKAQGDATATDLAAQGDAATAQVKTRGEEETKAIAGARQAADNRRRPAAGGSRWGPRSGGHHRHSRDAYLERIDTARAGGVAAYRAASETRCTQLDQAGEQQKTQYRGAGPDRVGPHQGPVPRRRHQGQDRVPPGA